jgi:hypothetical protein
MQRWGPWITATAFVSLTVAFIRDRMIWIPVAAILTVLCIVAERRDRLARSKKQSN